MRYLRKGLFTEGYFDNNASGGGVDTTQPQPSYQTDYGITFTDLFSGLPGRSAPDVTANAGGNMFCPQCWKELAPAMQAEYEELKANGEIE